MSGRRVVKMEQNTTTIAQRKPLFKAVSKNLKSFGSQNQLAIGDIPLELLYVDERYQDMRRHPHLNRLIANWDERKLTPIVVIPHPEECRFAIGDGKGRYIAATDLKYESLQAIVLTDAPKDEHERLIFEAQYFIGQDSETESVKLFEKHLANCILNDEKAKAVDWVTKKYNVQIVAGSGRRKASVLNSYPTTYKIARHGRDCLDWIFGIIVDAGWNLEQDGFSAYIVTSLSDIYIAHMNEREVVRKYLTNEMRKYQPKQFSDLANAAYINRHKDSACALYMEDLLTKNLKINRRIYTDGICKCKVVG